MVERPTMTPGCRICLLILLCPMTVPFDKHYMHSAGCVGGVRWQQLVNSNANAVFNVDGEQKWIVDTL